VIFAGRPYRPVMVSILFALISIFAFRFRSRASLLRRQRPGRPQLSSLDRLLWVWLYRIWQQVIDAMVLVKPATVVQWHRKGFRLNWRWRSRRLARPPLEGIAVPTLVISARDDLCNTLPAAEFAASTIPNAKLVVYDTAGIWRPHDEPPICRCRDHCRPGRRNHPNVGLPVQDWFADNGSENAGEVYDSVTSQERLHSATIRSLHLIGYTSPLH
jgi:pimeloyl-ACP methyl ester carboxylesterase